MPPQTPAARFPSENLLNTHRGSRNAAQELGGVREADRWELEQTVHQGEERWAGAPQLQTLPVVFAQL